MNQGPGYLNHPVLYGFLMESIPRQARLQMQGCNVFNETLEEGRQDPSVGTRLGQHLFV